MGRGIVNEKIAPVIPDNLAAFHQVFERVVIVFLALQPGIFHPSARSDVTDITLNNILVGHLIDVADEFYLNQLSILRFERQVIVADVFILLQCFEGILTGFNILEGANFQSFFLINSSCE